MTDMQAIKQICHAHLKSYLQYINAASLKVCLGMGDPFLFFFKPKFNLDFNKII